MDLVSMMKSKGVRPDEVVYNSLLDGCSKAGELGISFEIFNSMNQDDIKPSTISYNSLIDGCVRAGDIRSAWGLLD
jgi:pentatricopeptide repeat protein